MSSRYKVRPQPLQRGDVIKTHPRDGFWGCAIVLTEPTASPGFRAFCHIGITPLIVTHDFVWEDIAATAFSILEFDRAVRIGEGTYGTRRETCIGQYTADQHPLLPVVGKVDPDHVFPYPLTFEVGDGTDGKYPLCGPIKAHLGSEAVVAWLRAHDPVRWQAERDAARESFERLLERLKQEDRQKREVRRQRRDGA